MLDQISNGNPFSYSPDASNAVQKQEQPTMFEVAGSNGRTEVSGNVGLTGSTPPGCGGMLNIQC